MMVTRVLVAVLSVGWLVGACARSEPKECVPKEGQVIATSRNDPSRRNGPATYRDDAEFDSIARAGCWTVPR